MITKNTAVKGCENFYHLAFFNLHLNLSTRASRIFAFIQNIGAAVRILNLPKKPASLRQKLKLCLSSLFFCPTKAWRYCLVLYYEHC